MNVKLDARVSPRRSPLVRSRAGAALLLVSLPVVGCFATRNDVRILQGDVFALRSELARSDSARERQIAALASSVAGALGGLRDSLAALSLRLVRYQADLRQDLSSLERQLQMMGELTGEAQRRIAQFAAELEGRGAQQAVRTDTGGAAVTGGAAGAPVPGPYTLYLLGREQLQQNSFAAARGAFATLLREYPQSELAPNAQLSLAIALEAEGLQADADTAYQAVVSRYPSSSAVPTARYKLALSLARQGRRAEARAAMERIVREYPRTEEAELAADWLRRNP
jgi:tol-pal system protein YbgF